MQKIVPHLWFDKEAREAANFYCDVFPNSKIISTQVLEDTPSGSVDAVDLEIWDFKFQFISAGPYFKINSSVSFTVICETEAEVDEIWSELSKGGMVLMPLQAYPFSRKYGWVKDKYGVSWQILLIDQKAPEQRIVPAMMFAEDVCGKVEEAVNFYLEVFANSKLGDVLRYGEMEEAETEGVIQYMGFQLEGQSFSAMDSPHKQSVKFNEGVSFIVRCEGQEEIDYFWQKLSAVPEAEQCGWLKDKYGFSWQITPRIMEEMMSTGTKEQISRVVQAFLKMKKFDIKKLQRAFDGE